MSKNPQYGIAEVIGDTRCRTGGLERPSTIVVRSDVYFSGIEP
jgi:hypothetical protein